MSENDYPILPPIPASPGSSAAEEHDTLEATIRKVAVDALYEARNTDKVMDEAAAIVAAKVLEAFAPRVREIAGMAAGAASGVFMRMHTDMVMPSAEVGEAVDLVLQSFSIERPDSAPRDADTSDSSSENEA